MNCGNCKSLLSCGCKVRSATDGTSCCTACVADYNARLQNGKAQEPHSPNNPRVKVIYDNPKR